MSLRVAINGFGRIGRAFYRAWFQRRLSAYAGIEIVAVNDKENPEHLAYLLQHDSVYRRFLPECRYNEVEKSLQVASFNLPVSAASKISSNFWGTQANTLDWVVDATGCGDTKAHFEQHIEAGANRVLITSPVTDAEATLVAGVNDHLFDDNCRTVSAASCTTHALAAVCHPLLSKVSIDSVMMTEIHASTLDQPMLDTVHAKMVRGRAGAFNMVPTMTTGDRVIGEVLPELKGKVSGYSMRVPVLNGACIDLTIALAEPVTESFIKSLFREAASEPNAIIGIAEQPFVSSDVTQNALSAIIDFNHVRVNDRLIQILAWYDNEWGYVSRLLDFLASRVTPNPQIEKRKLSS